MKHQTSAADEQARKDKIRIRLMRDFEFYAPNILKIRLKTAKVEPFRLNEAQVFLHRRIEEQLVRTGRVRKIILKGRQTGASTYITGRGYWKTTHNKGMQSFILTHEDAATANLFTMTNRYHENCPPDLRPSTGAANARELLFDRLDSGFKVATAGNKGAGRSSTLQFFHGSEVAFWPNAGDHVAGVLQAVADVPGSEGYLESTANGIGNVFHTMWKQAEAGEIDFEPIFIPWFWSTEYTRAITGVFQPSEEWTEYQEIFQLTDEQLFWAMRKNGELLVEQGSDGDPERISPKFKQEYPGTSEQAFETSGQNAFINPLKVLKARKAKVEGYGPIILGVDPARGGKDKTAIIDRQGRRMGGLVRLKVDYGENIMAIAHAVKSEALKLIRMGLPLRKVCVDVTGLGAGVADRLEEILPDAENLLEKVNFAEGAHEPLRFANRRAEMWDRKREWYNDTAGVQVPDLDEFQGEECAPIVAPGATHHRSNGQLVLEPKDKIKARIGISPDYGDAAALTFAPDMTLIFEKKRNRGKDVDATIGGGSSWSA